MKHLLLLLSLFGFSMSLMGQSITKEKCLFAKAGDGILVENLRVSIDKEKKDTTLYFFVQNDKYETISDKYCVATGDPASIIEDIEVYLGLLAMLDNGDAMQVPGLIVMKKRDKLYVSMDEKIHSFTAEGLKDVIDCIKQWRATGKIINYLARTLNGD